MLSPATLSDLRASVGEMPDELRKEFEAQHIKIEEVDWIPRGDYENLRRAHDGILLRMGEVLTVNSTLLAELNTLRGKTDSEG
jgi:CBS domain containing-hemolysin-like protein